MASAPVRTQSQPAGDSRRLRALFLGSAYAGHSTRFAALQRQVEADERFEPTFRRVSGWRDGGRLEALPLLPRAIRGRIRATLEASAFAAFPRPDVIWTSATQPVLPFLWAQAGPLRRPLVLDLDSTWSQLEAMSIDYKGRAPRTGLVKQQALARERMLFSRVSHFTPWSEWAAQGLRAAGVPDERITVIPPGVDLALWSPAPHKPGERLRLLFVGGDFQRKGGDILLDVMRSPLGESFELDIVTRDDVKPGRNVRVHRFEQGQPGLVELYQRADLFVMPSRAECFGLATVEAMAAGLPVVVSDVGAAREIVGHGQTGWLVEAGSRTGLSAALSSAGGASPDLRAMSLRARQVAESRFSVSDRNRQVLDTLVTAVRQEAPRRP